MLLPVRENISASRDYRQAGKKSGKPVLDSGNYRYGFVVTDRGEVLAGTYLLIVSTFDPGQLGVFNVKVCSSVKVKIEVVP